MFIRKCFATANIRECDSRRIAFKYIIVGHNSRGILHNIHWRIGKHVCNISLQDVPRSVQTGRFVRLISSRSWNINTIDRAVGVCMLRYVPHVTCNSTVYPYSTTRCIAVRHIQNSNHVASFFQTTLRKM